MEARFGKAHQVWAMDRGMVSARNLAWLNQTGRRYVIGAPKAELRRFVKEIAGINQRYPAQIQSTAPTPATKISATVVSELC